MAYTRTPKYQAVADTLREDITNGVVPAGAPLPSESQLIERFAVSRDTVRAAVAALRKDGLVTVVHGRGAYVRRRTERPDHTHRRGITRTVTGTPPGGTARFGDTDLDSPDWHPVEDPAHYRSDATTELALVFGTSEHAPLFIADRLLADKSGRRMSHRLYLPVETCMEVPALTEDPFRAPGELYTILTAAGHNLEWIEQVRALIPTPDDAATLNIPDSTPMLVTRRVTITHSDTTAQGWRVLAMEETRLSAENAQLSYGITPMTVSGTAPSA